MSKNYQKGFMVLVGVMLSIIILSVAFGVLNIALKEVNFSSLADNTNDASFAADVGVECALYHDKATINSFPLADIDEDINCAGMAIDPSYSGDGATLATYTFKITGLGSSNQACVDVSVVKDNTDPLDPTTEISAKGYNIGDGSCNSSNPNRVERQFLVSTGDLSGGGSPPPPPPPPGTYDLSVSLSGTGSGTVTGVSNPSQTNINCGSTCSLNYTSGTTVTLSAAAGGGSTFAGWSGGGCSGTGTCIVTMSSVQNVTATFNLSAQPITLDSVSDSGIRTGNPIASPITWNHTIGAGSNTILIVTTSQRSGTTPSAVSYNGVAMTKIRGDSNGIIFSSIWYLVNPAAGTHAVNVTVATSNNFQGNGVSLFNVNQSTPVDAHNGANGSSAGPVTTTVTTVSANTWIVDVAAKRTAASEALNMTAMTNRVERENSLTAANGVRTGVSTVGPATAIGNYIMQWTTTGSNAWAISAAAFKQ